VTIRFVCPECKRTIKAQPALAGKRRRCPNLECQAVVTVPNAGAATDGAGLGVSIQDAVSRDSGSDRTPGGSPAADGVPADWKPGDVILDLYEVKTFDAAGRVDHEQGGFGRVHRVHHRGWNVDLAVKSPRPGLFASSRDQQKFLAECETWINLGLHPHIVSCHYVRVLGGIPRVFAEFVEGGNLKEWIDEGRLLPSPAAGRGAGGEGALESNSPLNLHSVLDTAIQIAWGMAFAHSKGLVHRDLKPANVLMTAHGTAKVTDFGLARHGVTSGEAGDGGTTTNVLVSTGSGTPGYGAPEQWSAGRPVDHRADIFAFGVTLWRMLGGRISWADVGRKSVIARHAVTAFVKRGEPGGLPERLVDLILRCLQPDPDDRWPDFAAIVGALQQIYAESTDDVYDRPEPRTADALADVLNNRALTLLDLGKTDAAVQIWQQALAADAMHLDSVYNYGLLQWRAAEIDDVTLVARVRQAGLGAEPWRAAVLAAQVELERDDCQAAIEVLEAVAEPDGKREEVTALLAVARQRLPSSRRCVRTFTGHTGDVLAVCLSSDGRYALSGSSDTTLKLWDVATGKCLRTFEGHSRPVHGVALTSDGRYGVSASADKTLKQWELTTGSCSRTFEGHKLEYDFLSAVVNSVFLSRNSGSMLSSSEDKTLRLWELDSGQCLKTFTGHTDRVADACLSFDGRHALSGGSDKSLRFWDVNDGKCLRTFEGHDGLVFSVCLSSDGRYALSGSADTTVKLWEVESGRCVRTFPSHTGDVNGVCLSPDGRMALSASSDQTLKLWEVASGRCLRTFADHTGAVHAVGWNSSGRYAVSGGAADQTVKLWEPSGNPDRPAAWEVSQPEEGGASSEAAAQFVDAITRARRDMDRGDAQSAARSVRQARAIRGYQRHAEAVSCWSDLYVRLPKVAFADGWVERTMHEHAGGVNAVCLGSDGRTALSASSDGTLKLWELESGWCVRTFEGHTGAVHAIGWSLGGGYALSGGVDRTLRLWEVSSGKCLRTFEGHGGSVMSGVLSTDSRYALSGSADQTLRLWDCRSGRCLRTYRRHTADVNSVCLGWDGRYALSGSSDTTLRLWEVATGNCLRTFEGHTSLVSSVCLSLDGSRALSASWDGTVKLWDVAAGSCLQTFEGHTRAVNSVSISLDGGYALSGSSDGTVKIWETGSGRCLRTFEGHRDLVHSVCFSLDGGWALSAGEDRALRLYRLDWELGNRSPADWDEAARPYLDAFLSQQRPYAAAVPTDHAPRDEEVTLALTRRGMPTWTDQEFRQRLCGLLLGCGGLGWLRADGVQREVEKAATAWKGPSKLGSPAPARAVIRAVARLPQEIEVRGIKLRLIPAGRFLMGAPDTDENADSAEKPQHLVRITKPFYLGIYPVTQSQYEAVLGSNPSYFGGDENRPVEVSWEEAMVFCRKRTDALRSEGGVGTFRLPSEAEWEYACRAGTNTRYCFGDDAAGLDEYAWYGNNSGNTTHPVGQKKANAWGLYDMHGNVWEWCQDWYEAGYYAGCPREDPSGPSGRSHRVLRGGCWLLDASYCRVSCRGRIVSEGCGNHLGFRLLRSVS
jgi:WD40 repeat protein/formylglycine-generating enzyme required for sulfatase activity/serine/threonine protein kinase